MSEIVSTTTVLPPAASCVPVGRAEADHERVELVELAVVELGVGAEHDEREALAAGAPSTGWWRSQAPGEAVTIVVTGALERVDGDRGGAQVRLGLAVDDQPGRSRCDPVLELLRPHGRGLPVEERPATSIRRRAPRWMPLDAHATGIRPGGDGDHDRVV